MSKSFLYLRAGILLRCFSRSKHGQTTRSTPNPRYQGTILARYTEVTVWAKFRGSSKFESFDGSTCIFWNASVHHVSMIFMGRFDHHFPFSLWFLTRSYQIYGNTQQMEQWTPCMGSHLAVGRELSSIVGLSLALAPERVPPSSSVDRDLRWWIPWLLSQGTSPLHWHKWWQVRHPQDSLALAHSMPVVISIVFVL